MPSAWRTGSTLEAGHGLRFTDHLGVLRLQVEEVGLVRRRVAITARVGDDERA